VSVDSRSRSRCRWCLRQREAKPLSYISSYFWVVQTQWIGDDMGGVVGDKIASTAWPEVLNGI